MSGSLKRVKLVAKREFLTTVVSKGFIIGVLLMPVLITMIILVLPKLMANRGMQFSVEVGVIDRSRSEFSSSLGTELSPEAIAARREANRRQAQEQLGPAATATRTPDLPVAAPTFTLRELPADATISAEEAWLFEKKLGKQQRRALVVIPEDAVRGSAQQGFSTYEFHSPRNLPPDVENILHAAIRPALVSERLRTSGFDPALVSAATTIPRPRVFMEGGSQQGGQVINRLMPFIMAFLLFMGIMTGGQALMTSTVEEKSSRVVEVLLAAVSSLELMWGKLLGQLGAGLVVMGMYVGLGVVALLQSAMFGLVDPMMIVWLFVFFLTAYLVFGALMMAIGAAVNQMADAQSLMGPVMLVLIVPYLASFMVGNAPDSAFAVTASFIPPINGFIIMSRLASSSPPALWQVLLSVVVSLATAWIAVWFAAKVFRVGLLMHGKPPSFGTLVKWARMS